MIGGHKVWCQGPGQCQGLKGGGGQGQGEGSREGVGCRLAPSADVFTISMCSTLLTFRMFTLSLASMRVMKGKKYVVCSLQFFDRNFQT